MPETKTVSDQILNSWKEIAQYLNRGVRTVQRWESELGLPVRRPRGRRRSAVIAMRADIDDWLSRCPVEAREQVAQSSGPVVLPVNGNNGAPATRAEAERSVSQLIVDSRNLRTDLERSRRQLEEAVALLLNTIQSYQVILQDVKKPGHLVETLELLDTTRVA
jgi:hypothetical protein